MSAVADPRQGRVPCDPPLTKVQMRVAELLAAGLSVKEVAESLHVSCSTVKFHVRQGAERIPGDLDPRFKMIAWWRRAPLSVLHMQTALSSAASLREALRLSVLPLR